MKITFQVRLCWDQFVLLSPPDRRLSEGSNIWWLFWTCRSDELHNLPLHPLSWNLRNLTWNSHIGLQITLLLYQCIFFSTSINPVDNKISSASTSCSASSASNTSEHRSIRGSITSSHQNWVLQSDCSHSTHRRQLQLSCGYGKLHASGKKFPKDSENR